MASPEKTGSVYGQVAIRGVAWMTSFTLFSKLLSVGAQIVLGWLLVPDDYGAWAVSVAVYGIFASIRNGGLQKILIQRSDEYDRLASPALQIAVLTNLGLAALIVLAAPLIARSFNLPQVEHLLWILAATAVVATPGFIFQARLLADLKFRTVSLVQSSSAVITYSLMVVFALNGMGALSFVLPALIAAIFEGIAYYYLLASFPRFTRLTLPVFSDLFIAGRWIILASLATVVFTSGPYLVIGRMQPDLLGDYTFGFQMSAAFAVFFAFGARSVLMPTMTRLKDTEQRFGQAYRRSLALMMFVTAPICIAVALIAESAVDIVWQGKWNAAIPVVQLMTVSLAFRFLSPISFAALEAKGHWKTLCGLMSIDAAATLLAAYIGCRMNQGLYAIAWAIAINRAVMALFQSLYAGALAHSSPRQTLAAFLPTLLAAILWGGAALWLADSLIPTESTLAQNALAVSIYLAGMGLTLLTVLRKQVRSAVAEFQMLRGSLVRPTTPGGQPGPESP